MRLCDRVQRANKLCATEEASFSLTVLSVARQRWDDDREGRERDRTEGGKEESKG